MADFPKGTIEVRYNTNNWGPFDFDVSDVIPDGDSLASVTVRAFVGNVKPTSDLSQFTEIPTGDANSLIDYDRVSFTSGNIIKVFFAYPGDAYKGSKVTLVFEITTAIAATHNLYFQYVKIQ